MRFRLIKVDTLTKKLISFVEGEIQRYEKSTRGSSNVHISLETYKNIPMIDICITNRHVPRVFRTGSFSLYRTPPLIRDY